MSPEMNRREFLSGAAAAAATFTIVPRRVLGGAGFVAPSDKVTLACVGFGTQAIREIGGILASPEVEVVAVCDVDRDGAGYLEWGRNQIRDGIRRMLDNPAWREGVSAVPGGLNVGKEIVDTVLREVARRRAEEGMRRVRGLPRAAGEGEGRHGGEGHDAGSHACGHFPRGTEEGHERDRAQAPGQPRDGSQGRHRGRARGETRHPFPARERGRRPEAGAGHGPERGHRDAPRDSQLVGAADVAAVCDDPRRHAAGAARLRLEPVAGPVARPALSPGVHAHELPQLVRVRRRIGRRHGALQPAGRSSRCSSSARR